jgi:hypothetical protein
MKEMYLGHTEKSRKGFRVSMKLAAIKAACERDVVTVSECQDLWPICREPHGVTPAKAGVQPPRAGHEPYITSLARLDSGVRRNDEIFAGIEH